MKRPAGGWPKYYSDKEIDFVKIIILLIIFSLLSFMTSCHFDGNVERQSFATSINNPSNIPLYPDGVIKNHNQPSNIIGPIAVRKSNVVYHVEIKTSLPVQSWAYIEGAVLDQNKEYLYSFGKELWHEAGRDSEGPWRENNNSYGMKLTFKRAGIYYLQINNENNIGLGARTVTVELTQKRGSSLPHFWFGIVCFLCALILSQIKRREVTSLINRYLPQNDCDARVVSSVIGFILCMLIFGLLS